MQHNLDTETSKGVTESDGDESLEDDDLPVMMEKKKPTRSPLRPEAQSVPTQEPEEAEGEQDDHLLDSLPGFSEPIRVTQAKTEATNGSNMTRLSNASAAPTNSSNAPPGKAQQRTRLHQQLIDQRIRYKRQEILGHAFVRWRRGLRVQRQNRVTRGQQLQKTRLRLVLCRRDNCFSQWKAVSQLMSQVINCRVDAFQQRVANRLVRRVWTEWRIRYLRSRRQLASLGSVLRSQWKKRIQQAFAHWQKHSVEKRHKQTVTMCLDEHRSAMDRYKERLSRLQCAQRGVRSRLLPILRNWKQLAQQQRSRRECIRRLIKRGFLSKQKRMAWITWKQVALLTKHVDLLHNQHDDRLKAAIEEQRQLHQQLKQEADAYHEKEAQALREQAERATTRVRQLQQAKQKTEQQKVRAAIEFLFQWRSNAVGRPIANTDGMTAWSGSLKLQSCGYGVAAI